MQIGFEGHTGKFYEGMNSHGRQMDQSPFVSPCIIQIGNSEPFIGPDRTKVFEIQMFREDYFDPISRVRRGRLYQAQGGQPAEWWIDGNSKRMDTYFSYSIFNLIKQHKMNRLHLVMGDQLRFTVWKVVDLEIIVTGEELITLKSLSTFGVLPDLNRDIENKDSSALTAVLDKVRDQAYRSTPESVVDLCRDAVTCALGIFLQDRVADLGGLVTKLDSLGKEQKRRLAHSSAKIINDLHPRRKPNEQEKHNLRPLSDEDAQLAINCLGTVLVELGYAAY